MGKRMIRKVFSAVLMLDIVLFAGVAWAQTGEETALAAYPEYHVTASDSGSGFEVLALERGEKTALCVVENGALTIANERAFPAGRNVSIMVDTDGNSLFISYNGESGSESVTLHSVHRNGEWSAVDVLEQDRSSSSYICETSSWLRDGLLWMEYDAVYDKNENLFQEPETAWIPVGNAFDMSLGGINMLCFPTTREACDRSGDSLPDGFAAPLLNEGEKLLQMGAYTGRLILLVEMPDGSRRVRVCDWNGSGYDMQDSGRLSNSASLDIFHANRDVIYLKKDKYDEYEAYVYEFGITCLGEWMLKSVSGEYSFSVGADCVEVEEDTAVNWERNKCWVYGKSTPLKLATLDENDLPKTREEAVARLDESAYAFVNNDNPADRLHLREAPDRNSRSLGKFYNRTPVQVLERAGEWTRVRIGMEKPLEGWMMTKYLKFGGGDRSVQCAFEALWPRDESAPMYSRPKDTAESYAVWSGGYVIGVYGDDWVIVMTWDGEAGYALRSDLMRLTGNG